MKTIFQMINPDNTLSVNRRLAHAVGLQEAVVYSALLAKYAWYESQGRLAEDGWFYSTAEDLEESTALSVKQQRRCIDNLMSAGLVLCRQMGMPAKRYFYIVDDIQILERLLECGAGSEHRDDTPSFAEREKQDAPKKENMPCHNGKTCSSQTDNKTKDNKTKENNQKINKQSAAREQIRCEELSAKYGEGFADLAAEVVAEGISSDRTDQTDGLTDSPDSVSSVFKRVDFDTVCHVADYISSRKCDIRNMRAYLRSALYKAVGESDQKPRSAPGDIIPGIPEDELMAELRAQYAL